MKKKLTALCAAMVMTFGCLVLPAQAEETKYQKGDINMDGVVDCRDAMLAQWEYTVRLAHLPTTLTEEQILLANVDGESSFNKKTGDEYPVTVIDSLFIAHHYARSLAYYVETMEETIAFVKDEQQHYELTQEQKAEFQANDEAAQLEHEQSLLKKE